MCYFVTNESKNHHFHGLLACKSACGIGFIGLVSFSRSCASLGGSTLSQGCFSWLRLWPPLGNSFLYFVKSKASGLGLVTTYGSKVTTCFFALVKSSGLWYSRCRKEIG